MEMQPTQVQNSTLNEVILAVALELSLGSWKIALQDGRRDKPLLTMVAAEGAQERLLEAVQAIEGTRQKWQLDKEVRVVVMYEAGQDGFWIYRELKRQGYEALVIDPASIPVERHARRAKTDRLDAIKLVTCLRAWLRGERDRMHVVYVPTAEAQAQRQLTRDRGELQKEIGQHRDRMRKLLRTEGCWVELKSNVGKQLASGQLTCHDGAALPAELVARLERECARLAVAEQQLSALEKSLVRQLPAPVQNQIHNLARLKGIGEVGAMRLNLELFWRTFNNRRQVGACVGLVPQPYDSGESRRDQGISKQGNRRVRALLIEMAWLWLRYQPRSELACWFNARTCGSGTSKRARRIAIVAVARRLVIALWRYSTDGVIPKGAELKGC
jgi:transposase